MSFRLALKPALAVSLQQVLFSQMLQASGTELEELLRREMEQNPALELVSGRTRAAGDWRAADDRLEQLPEQRSPLEQLEAQLCLITDEQERALPLYLLHCLDRHGYLRRDVDELAVELALPAERVQQALQIVQRLEPPGIGARTVRECLLLQCTELAANGTDCGTARRVLDEGWEELVQQRWKALARKLRLSPEEVQAARGFIRYHLYPYPLLLLPEGQPDEIRFRQVDLVIQRVVPGSYVLLLSGPAPELRLSRSFLATRSREHSSLSAREREWIDEHVQRARLLINAVAQRRQTVRRIGEFLIAQQRPFLDRGPLYLRSLTRAAVASELGLHPSTVGRAVRDKVVQLPDGQLVLLADFFDDSLPAKTAIRQVVANTEEPLSDGEVARQLAEQGIHLARRTVTKYRQQMGIQSSHHRQESVARPLAGNRSGL